MTRSNDTDWQDECFLCGESGGEVLCCESCTNVVHPYCYKAHITYWPINKETDDYYCAGCVSDRTRSSKLKVLELFKGTGSITSYCMKYPELYEKPISLDFNPNCEASIIGDITTWNYSELQHIEFDIIWASPPCTAYSRLRTTGGPADIEEANKIVQSTLEIISFLQPKTWFIENPATGRLKDQVFMFPYKFFDVDYCKCSTFGYRKRTRIWTNMQHFEPWLCRNDCGFQGPKGHINTFGGNNPNTATLEERYRVPQLLIHRLFTQATGKIYLP